MGVESVVIYHFSHNLRYHVKHLLEHAKRAIDQDEQAAIDWLESVSEVADI